MTKQERQESKKFRENRKNSRGKQWGSVSGDFLVMQVALVGGGFLIGFFSFV